MLKHTVKAHAALDTLQRTKFFFGGAHHTTLALGERQLQVDNDIAYMPAEWLEWARLNCRAKHFPNTSSAPKPAQPMCIRMCRLYPHAGPVPIPKHRGTLLTIPPHSSSGARHDFTRLMLPYGQHKPTPVRCLRHAQPG